MNALRRFWSEFFFGKESPETLGIARLLFLGSLFALYLTEDLSAWGAVAPAFWEPIALFRVLPFGVPSVETLEWLQAIFRTALLAGALGLFTRTSCAVAAILGLFLLGLPHNFGKTHHFDTVIVLTLTILALARSGDSWSIDAWRRRGTAPPAVASAHYRWPIRTVWLLLAMVFFSAGALKLRNGRLDWMFSDNLSVMLVQHAYQVSNADPLVNWGLWLAQFPTVCAALAVMTVFVEFCYPLALFDARARIFFPAAMCLTLLGIRVLMGPTFGLFILCHLFWVPWDRVAAAVRARVSQHRVASRPALIGIPVEYGLREALAATPTDHPKGTERHVVVADARSDSHDDAPPQTAI